VYNSGLTFTFLVINNAFRKTHLISDTSPSLEEPESALVAYLQGLLVIQDLQMAAVVALIPLLVTSNMLEYNVLQNCLYLFQIIIGFIFLILITNLLAQKALQPAFKVMLTVKNKGECLLLGSLSICFIQLTASVFIGGSQELGSFLAGVAMTVLSSKISEQIKRLIEPIKDIFSAIFFASIGFHIFPTFLISEFITIFLVTLSIMMFKVLINISLVNRFTGCCSFVSWFSCISLAPISEFGFIICSKARRVGLISRETYLILISVTALSLIISPFMWHLSYILLQMKKPKSSIKCTFL
jgi:Kef-type K+ transport system membrane component KefB